MGRTAFITGITGQDGSYLAEFLLAKGYSVHGLVRRPDVQHLERLGAVLDRVVLHQGDLVDQLSLISALEKSAPDEIYNLAAQSFVPTSYAQPVLTMEYSAAGVGRLLEAARLVGGTRVRFYQASSSEMFGATTESPQRETTPFYPRSPYGAAKLYSHWITVNYRESFGMFCVSGILYNHESPRRGREFVTRKITDAAARIKLGLADSLELGNLAARRDWGFAGDYVQAMWLMLQRDEPEDFVIGAGVQHGVQEFAELAFGRVGLDWRDFVRTDKSLLRPNEADNLVSDPTKAREKLGWKATVGFRELVEMMVDADLAALENRGR